VNTLTFSRSSTSTAARTARLLATLGVAWLAAQLCVHLKTPLPWMIGPLLATAALTISGVPLQSSRRLRNAGQWVVGTVLGLYFTPAVAAQSLALAPWMLLGAAWALLMGYLFGRWLLWSQPAGSVDATTAYFASVIGGASEMAAWAERVGARVDLVAAAHSLRVMLVVIVIPFTYQGLGLHGHDPAPVSSVGVQPAGLAALLAATAAGALLLHRLRQPNPWVLGALLVAMGLTASGVAWTAMPGWLSAAAQLSIGIALGTRFTPDFLHTAPRWLLAVAVGTLAMIAASAVYAWGVARLAELVPATVLLGNSPGGIAEMCITAKVLDLGVALVTGFHVVRYVIVLVLTGPIWARWVRPRPDRSDDRAATGT
jgi:membrane AbrB-like protein